MRNVRLLLEFDGAGFAGWQYQPRHRTVQGELENALEAVTGAKTKVYGSSRTDSGVSARNYVANFLTASRLGPEQLGRALNFHLPEDIRVKSVAEVPPDFHARFSARGKTYVYRIVRGRSPLRRTQAWEIRFPVDRKRMRRALALFQGTHDFRPFCHTQETSGVCRLSRLGLAEQGDEIAVTVGGNRFLYKMVRRIVGAAVAYGAGRMTLTDIRAALAGGKHQPFQTAPAQGLVLDSVEY